MSKFSMNILSNLQFIENLCTFRLCDEYDIEEILRIIRSNSNPDFNTLYSLEKIELDFNTNDCQWYALEMNGPDELLSVCGRLEKRNIESKDERTASIFAHSLLDSSASKSLLLQYFFLQFQEMCLNLNIPKLVVEVICTNNSVIEILETENFIETGGYLLNESQIMVIQYAKIYDTAKGSLQVLADPESEPDSIDLENLTIVEEINDNPPVSNEPMISIIQDLFQALNKSEEFQTNP